MERRHFIASLISAGIVSSIDIEKYLWTRRKTIFIPSKAGLLVKWDPFNDVDPLWEYHAANLFYGNFAPAPKEFSKFGPRYQ